MKLIILNKEKGDVLISIPKTIYDQIVNDYNYRLTTNQFINKYGISDRLVISHIDDMPAKYIGHEKIARKGINDIEVKYSYICFVHGFKGNNNNLIIHEDKESSKKCLKTFIKPNEYIFIFNYKNENHETPRDILQKEFWQNFSVSHHDYGI